MCANAQRAQELVNSHSDDVYMEPPMDCEKYKTSKIMYDKNIFWIYLIIGKYFGVRRVRFYFMGPKRMPKNRGVYPRARLSGLMSAHTRPSYCTHLRAAGQLLAAAGAAARQLARGWQPCAKIQKSRHMAGSHVRVIRFSTVRAHP